MSRNLCLRPPFRAEHIGSLQRPEELLKKRAEFQGGSVTQEELARVEDESIKKILDMQRKAGINAMTDGEFRREGFYSGFFDNLEGMTFFKELPHEYIVDYFPTAALHRTGPSWICTGKITRTKPLYARDFDGLKKFCLQEEISNLKLTLCAPEWYHLRHGSYTYDRSVYADDEAYFADIVTAYREELHHLHSLGCRNVQFDDPLLAYFCSEPMLIGMKGAGVDPDALMSLYVKTYNQILEGKPAEMTVGVHLCRGNFSESKWLTKGGYETIAEKLFKDLNVDVFYLEYDTERAGTFAPLKLLPKNKVVVLGLFTTKVSEMEDLEEMKRRVNEAADTIADGEVKRPREEALNQICVSPQCGFSSHSSISRMSDEDVFRKLELVSKLAGSVWPDS